MSFEAINSQELEKLERMSSEKKSGMNSIKKIFNFEDIKIVVAANRNTLPKYLYFLPGIIDVDLSIDSLKVLDIQELIKKNIDNDLFDIFEKIPEKMLEILVSNKSLNDILYIYYSEKLKKKRNDIKVIKVWKIQFDVNLGGKISDSKAKKNLTILDTIYAKLKDSNIFQEDVFQILNRFSKDLEKKINNNKQKRTSIYETYKELEKNEVESSEFEIESTSFNIEFSLINTLSLMEIFNYIKLNKTVILGSINDINKIFKNIEVVNFTPDDFESWKETEKDVITLKVLKTDIFNNPSYSDYKDVIILYNTDENKFKIIIDKLELESSKSKQIFIDRIFEIFNPNLNFDYKKKEIYDSKQEIISENIKELEFNTTGILFFFGNTYLNIHVLQDLIMNNNLFSQMMYINEREKATKDKGANIYVYFKNYLTGLVKINLTRQKIESKRDKILEKSESAKFKEYYIRVKISKSSDLNSVNIFRKQFSILLGYYKTKYKEIAKNYNNLLGLNSIILEPPMIKETKGNINIVDISPKVFFRGWAILCNNKTQILDKDEINKLKLNKDEKGKYPAYIEIKEKGKKTDKKLNVMIYPSLDNKSEYPVTHNIKPEYYVCTTKSHSYPGLTENTRKDNKDKFPFIPCCFSVDQTIKPTSSYRHYFYKEKIKKIKTKQTIAIKSNKKILDKDIIGSLPKNINNILDFCNSYTDIDQNTNKPYKDNEYFYRLGVSSTTNSFLECIVLALKKPETNINNIRVKLATKKYAASCKQEMYDYSIEEIINKIKDTTQYFDPNFFINLLEIKFKCNIFLFRLIDEYKVDITRPRNSKGYYKFSRNYPCVFVYENVDQQRCDLIIKSKKIYIGRNKFLPIKQFTTDSNICKNIPKYFNKIFESYNLNQKISQNSTMVTNFIKKVRTYDSFKQGIDSFGKLRFISFTYNSENVTFMTSPLQPIKAQLIPIEKWKIVKETNRISSETLYKIKEELDMSIEKIIINYKDEYKCAICSIISDNIVINIPIKDEKVYEDIEKIKQPLPYLDQENSQLENYNKYKKLTRYIRENIFWLYSTYINKLKETDVLNSEINIETFFSEFILIDENFEYDLEKIPKKFDIRSGVFKYGKLVLKSIETLNRMKYTLKLFHLRNENELKNYFENVFIQDYYLNISDFEKHKIQYVLKGENLINVLENSKKYTLYNEVKFDTSCTYCTCKLEDEYCDDFKPCENNKNCGLEVDENGDTVYIYNPKPYFFKNYNIDTNVLLAQNISVGRDDNIKVLYKAIKIVDRWNKYNNNIGPYIDVTDEDIKDIKKLSYSLYVYESPDKITRHIKDIKGSDPEKIKVIIYKNNKTTYFTSLLSI
jgi:hypothetical protein